MRSLLPCVRFQPPDSLGDLIRAYEISCASGETTLEAFWDHQNRSRRTSTASLAALIKLDLQRRYDRGERPRVQEYLRRFSSLSADSSQVLSLVYEEFCLRGEWGETLDSQEFCEGYEPWRESILSQLAYHRDFADSLGNPPSQTRFPECGETFGKYLLREVLGQGAVARVYLATETDLWDRETVIKVSESFGQEPKILAMLDHPNIVPILTIAKSDRGLTGICMPYRRGITLETLIKNMGPGRRPESALALWKLLQPNQPTDASKIEHLPSGWMTYPMDGSFSEAIAWIGLALSQALGYLHSRDVLHRDIKPANVLLAFEGGPMLLDFNLAQDPSTVDNIALSARGGTLPYMAPEHLRAFLESDCWKFVDHQADLYSLGLVLRELLTGFPPELPQSTASLSRAIQELIIERFTPRTPAREINPLIPPSLDSIVEKCLFFEPSERYKTAGNLSEDLRRFIDRRALRYAENDSTAERAANWIYRNRPVAALLTITIIALILILVFRTPQSIADRTDFKKAEIHLFSSHPADWELARQTLSELHRQYPDSAWPTAYLALAMEKLDPTQKGEINRLMKEARERPDRKEALLSALMKEPGSALLLMNHALLLIDTHQENEAWESIRKSLKIDPIQISALIDLISLLRSSDQHERVVELCRSSIRIWNELKLDERGMDPLREVMLPILTKVAEKALEKVSIASDRLKSGRYLDEIESVLIVRYGNNRGATASSLSESEHFKFAFYRGVIASGRGLLASNELDRQKAKRFFDQAELSFVEAKNASPDLVKRQSDALHREREILDKRKAQLAKRAPG